jgi:YVTN family beta-propeller protein
VLQVSAMWQIEFHFPKTLLSIVLTVMLGPAVHPTDFSLDSEINTSSLAISPDGRTAAASSSDRSYVVIYDLDAKKPRGALHGFITPRSVLFDRSGLYLYVADSTLGVVKKIDSVSLQTVSVFLPVTGAFAAALSSDEQTLYVSNEPGSLVIVFDVRSGQLVNSITAYSESRPAMQTTPYPMLYAINLWNDKIAVVDTAANRIVDEILGFDQIRSIAVTRDGRTLFAANSGANTIAVVDLTSRSIIKEISVGKDPGEAETVSKEFVPS